jgi:tetratricopeptide (TPR) repeat protein
MTKYIIPFIALLGFSCGTSETENKGQDPANNSITVQDLLDSAQALSKNGDTQSYQTAIQLIDEAIAKDPNFKSAYIGKISVLENMGDDSALLTSMETAQAKFPNDPYLNLHLAMEYELMQDTAKAYPLYYESLESFAVVLDTMQNSALKRNSLLMNLAMANVLSPNKLSDSDVMLVLSPDEMENYKTSEETFASMDRQALLNLRRR